MSNIAIDTLKNKLHDLKVEKRVWSKEPNINLNIVKDIELEIETIEKAINILNNN